ncbi:MAG TPA: hypothetical protein VEL28_21380 [Candidatus Binatia bacterium]|nr:hypothetical protein [Candidatus Binatia bacterium]
MFVATACLLLAAAGATSARAQTALTGGRLADLRDRDGSAGDRARFVFRDAALAALPADPRCDGGGTVTLTLASTLSDHRDIELACEHWRARGAGYEYRDRDGTSGGVTLVSARPGSLIIKLAGTQYAAITGPVEGVEVGWRSAGAHYCGRFSTFRINEAAQIRSVGPTSACEVEPEPLLGSSRGGSAVWDYCYGKPDEEPVPADPRTLIQPGVNTGRAVHFNTWWKNCHVDPEAVQEVGAAATCGELRGRFERGGQILDPGGDGPGGLFTATEVGQGGNSSTFSAEQFSQLWLVWGGYFSRPENFDDLAAERYGGAFDTVANPYPLPGEDPNQTNGGSGRLPEMFTQMRHADGSWSGEITVTCHACHSGSVGGNGGAGPGMIVGGGSSLADLNLLLRDMLALGWESSAATVLNLNRTRGRNNASLVNLAFAMAGIHGPEVMAQLVTSGSTADMDTPAWWNMGHRPVKFVDGVFPMDAPRVDAIFYAPNLGTTPASQEWMRVNGPDMNAWVEALKAPVYPYPIDTGLAEQGAVLFHTLDMWAPERGNPVERPQGNGSCASCHGAYSPRYVKDPAFLETPALEAMAAYIVPLDIIGTDPERVLANNEGVQQAGKTSFFGYPQTSGTDQDCGPQNREELRGDREIGYLAPPLYGVWATAPYFHNGAVPNLWEVLQPADRKQIWRRVSSPVPAEQQDCVTCSVVTGYDTDLNRAFDRQKVGWLYEEIPCQVESATTPSVSPYVNCNPDPDEPQDPLAEQILTEFYSGVLLGWNLVSVPPLTDVHMEDRKIFNTRMFAQDNGGHEFNSVLTDQERLAIIEYLKTL